MSSRFDVLETLESHQRASLLRVLDKRDGREATLRRYHTEPDEVAGQRELLETLRDLGHPNLERILEVGEDEESLFAVVETPSGMTLAGLLKEGPLSEMEFEQVVRQMLGGLAVLHQRGIAHTSLRPEVVRVQRSASGQLEVRVGGFGEGFGRKSETEPAAPPAYRCTAPEQWRGDAVGRRTDVYAMGCIFYEALAGKPPFRPDSINGLRAAHLAHDPVPLVKEAPQVKPWICAWVLKLLDPDMNTRPRDAGTARKLFELREHGVPPEASATSTGLPPAYGHYGPHDSTQAQPPSPANPALVPVTQAFHPQPASSTTAFQPIHMTYVAAARPQIRTAAAAPKRSPQMAILGGAAFAVVVIVGLYLVMTGKPVMAPVSVRTQMQLPVTGGLLLHLDASRSETTETSITNKVTRWVDPEDKTRNVAPQAPENGPTLSNAALHGLPVLDFGPYHSEHWLEFKDSKGKARKLTTIRSVFWVMRGSGFLLGDNQAADFTRGGPEGSPDAGIFGEEAATGIKNSTLRLNGEVVKTTDTPLPLAFSLISMVTVDPLTASRLCKDRAGGENRVGGQEIAEVVIYDRTLDSAEVQQVETYLRTKWLAPK